MVMWKSVTSRVYCSLEARRCINSVVKVTKPVEVQTKGSPRETPSLRRAWAWDTSWVKIFTRFWQLERCRVSAVCSGQPASSQRCLAWSIARRACFSAATWCGRRPVRLTMKASSTILSLKTFAKYCSSALSERYMGGMFLTRMVFARGKGISFNHWYRRSVKCSCATATVQELTHTTNHTMIACTQSIQSGRGSRPMSSWLRMSRSMSDPWCAW
mmetsp:Transcript_122838/g.292206  ORF Transcript_122838/g.292206 Transcript_122838/m.292206 type:complete len:215 (+) Transcript_122838:106-750(+)